MKRILLSLVAIATISLSSFGQAPEGFKYQAVVRDAGNVILNNQAVGMRMTIQETSIGGTPVYTETFTISTNAYGLVNLEIGSGITTDDFTTIDWANGPYFMETAVDLTGGTSYVVMGTSQLMSVPYALHAKTAESSIIDNVNDADADPLNEMNTSVVLNGTDLETTDGNGTIVTDLSSLVDDADADPTNELQNIEQVLTIGNNANGINIVNTGNIGVGVVSPSEALEVNGNVSSDAYLFNVPNMRELRINPLDLNHFSNGAVINPINLGSDVKFTTNLANDEFLSYGIHLPQGATITGFYIMVYDGNPGNYSAEMIRHTGGIVPTVIGTTPTSVNMGPNQWLSSLALSNNVINNNSYDYSIRIKASAGLSTSNGLRAVRITYSVNAAD